MPPHRGDRQRRGHRSLELEPRGPGRVDGGAQGRGVRHPIPVDEPRLRAGALEPAVDLRLCPKRDDEADAEPVQQAEVADDASQEVFACDDFSGEEDDERLVSVVGDVGRGRAEVRDEARVA